MTNFAYTAAADYLFRGAINLRESQIITPTGVNETNIRAMLLASTSTCGPAGTNNPVVGQLAENVTVLTGASGFDTLGEYNNGASYVSGFGNTGRKNLTTQTVTLVQASKRSSFTADPLTWSSLAPSSVGTGVGKAMLIFFQPSAAVNDTTCVPLIYVDTVTGFSFPFTASGGNVTLTPNSIGIAIIGDKNLMSTV